MSSSDLRDLTQVDRTIHEPARLLILAILSTVAEADFLYLERETGLTKGNLSAHLSKLEEAGFVEIEKTYKGRLPMTLLRMTPGGDEAFRQYCMQMQQLIAAVQ